MNSVSERILAEAPPAAHQARIAERLNTSLDTDTEVEIAWQREVQQQCRAVENGELTLLSCGRACAKVRVGSARLRAIKVDSVVYLDLDQARDWWGYRNIYYFCYPISASLHRTTSRQHPPKQRRPLC